MNAHLKSDDPVVETKEEKFQRLLQRNRDGQQQQPPVGLGSDDANGDNNDDDGNRQHSKPDIPTTKDVRMLIGDSIGSFGIGPSLDFRFSTEPSRDDDGGGLPKPPSIIQFGSSGAGGGGGVADAPASVVSDSNGIGIGMADKTPNSPKKGKKAPTRMFGKSSGNKSAISSLINSGGSGGGGSIINSNGNGNAASRLGKPSILSSLGASAKAQPRRDYQLPLRPSNSDAADRFSAALNSSGDSSKKKDPPGSHGAASAWAGGGSSNQLFNRLIQKKPGARKAPPKPQPKSLSIIESADLNVRVDEEILLAATSGLLQMKNSVDMSNAAVFENSLNNGNKSSTSDQRVGVGSSSKKKNASNAMQFASLIADAVDGGGGANGNGDGKPNADHSSNNNNGDDDGNRQAATENGGNTVALSIINSLEGPPAPTLTPATAMLPPPPPAAAAMSMSQNMNSAMLPPPPPVQVPMSHMSHMTSSMPMQMQMPMPIPYSRPMAPAVGMGAMGGMMHGGAPVVAVVPTQNTRIVPPQGMRHGRWTPTSDAESASAPGNKGSRKPRKIIPAQKMFVEKSDNDVLFGRGGESNYHPGNKHYRHLVEEAKPRYLSCDKNQKTKVAQSVVDRIHQTGGRFLDKDKASGKWYVALNKVARTKVGQALRDRNTPEARAARRAKYGC